LAAINPKAGPMVGAVKTGVLAFAAFSKEHQIRVWSNNPLERISKEIERRFRVVGVFPNGNAAVRLAGAVFADTHGEWRATGRRRLSEESTRKLATPASYDEPVAVITSSDQRN
jgi:transposase-like protein